MIDIIMICIFGQEIIEWFVVYFCVLVINGLINEYYLCQVLVDIFIFIEQWGFIKSKIVMWVGDVNNMVYMWIQVVEIFGFCFYFFVLKGYQFDLVMVVDFSCLFVYVFESLLEVCEGVYLVIIDVWISMGYEVENEVCKKVFGDWMVIEVMMQCV